MTLDTPVFLRPHRTLLCIKGDERFEFLQGLVTCDVMHLKDAPQTAHHHAVYAFFLNAQGRYQFDAHLISGHDCLWLSTDCRGQDLLRHLSLYKLRRKVTLSIIENARSYVLMNTSPRFNASEAILYYQDPRTHAHDPHPWFHVIVTDTSADYCDDQALSDDAAYHAVRIQKGYPEQNGIPDGDTILYPYGSDLSVGRTFPLEVGAVRLNAISFKKGCYLGQEPVARAHYQGVVRKQLQTFATDLDNIDVTSLLNTPLSGENPDVSGVVTSYGYDQGQLFIMAMMRNYTKGPVSFDHYSLSPLPLLND